MENRPKKTFKLTYYNDTPNRRRVSLDGLQKVLAWVPAHDCEVFEVQLDAEYPELMIKEFTNNNVVIDTRSVRYGIGPAD